MVAKLEQRAPLDCTAVPRPEWECLPASIHIKITVSSQQSMMRGSTQSKNGYPMSWSTRSINEPLTLQSSIWLPKPFPKVVAPTFRKRRKLTYLAEKVLVHG